METSSAKHLPECLQDLTRVTAPGMLMATTECIVKTGCARGCAEFDAVGLSRYLRRLERGRWVFVVYPALSTERITMTKNIFRLGLVLALCGAMTACKKAQEAADEAAEAAEHAAHEAAEAAEAAGEAAGEAADKAGEAAADAADAVKGAAADVKAAGDKAVEGTKEAAAGAADAVKGAAADVKAGAGDAKDAAEGAGADAKADVKQRMGD